MPTITDYFHVVEREDSNCKWRLYTLNLSDSLTMDSLAKCIAEILVKIRCGESGSHTEWWTNKLEGRMQLTEIQRKILHAFLDPSIGTHANPAPSDQIQAVVAETIWYEMISKRIGESELLVRIEKPHHHVTEPGGDGLAVYRVGTNEFRFRLWEIKKHNQDESATSKITDASKQLNSKGAEYLAKWSKVDQEIDFSTPGLSEYYAQIVEKWLEVSNDSNAGISVVKNSDSYIIGTPVGHAKTILVNHTQPNQVELMVIDLENFSELASKTREVIWSGI